MIPSGSAGSVTWFVCRGSSYRGLRYSIALNDSIDSWIAHIRCVRMIATEFFSKNSVAENDHANAHKRLCAVLPKPEYGAYG